MAKDGYESAEALTINNYKMNHEWILDFGCSFHMCPMERWFQELKRFDGGLVLLGNDESYKVKGPGSVKIRILMART